MSQLLLSDSPASANDTIVEGRGEIFASCVANAVSTATQHYDPTDIIESIRADKLFPLREPILNIRETFANALKASGDRKAAKQAVDGLKTRLPAVMWSGRFRSRRSNDSDRLLQHSGLLCADLDELGNRITEVRKELVKSPHLWALFTSPTGDGLKCVFRVSADAAKHSGSFRAVEQHVRELSGIQIDRSCSDVARLCFLSHDPGGSLERRRDRTCCCRRAGGTERFAEAARAV
jgi:hypothetical protein